MKMDVKVFGEVINSFPFRYSSRAGAVKARVVSRAVGALALSVCACLLSARVVFVSGDASFGGMRAGAEATYDRAVFAVFADVAVSLAVEALYNSGGEFVNGEEGTVE
jgi:hypothetical protein